MGSTAPIGAAAPIDHLPGAAALEAVVASHVAALDAVRGALPDIALAADAVAGALARGAVIHYAAAGSSGLMALADASELPGTFGVPQAQVRISMAGGVPADGHMPGDTEDSTEDAARDAGSLRPGDVAIVVSASGTTPYALAFARAARDRGARVIGIANVAGSALLQGADIALALNTAPEVVEGSTRLGAGTAQKAALNMISTLAGVLLGHVHDGLMVNLHPDTIKLRRRARDIVTRIAGVDAAAAERALDATGYRTKAAVLVAAGGLAPDAAQTLLDRHRGRLGACLAELRTSPETTQ